MFILIRLISNSIILIFLILTTSCKKETCAPSIDTNKWIEKSIPIGLYTIKYIYPEGSERSGYQLVSNKIDPSWFSECESLLVALLPYDFTSSQNFELTIELNSFTPSPSDNKMPPVQALSDYLVNHFNSINLKNGLDYTIGTKSVEHIDYLHIVFYENSIIRNEVCRIPLTNTYYLSIGANYYKPFSQDPEWLANRRKIFDEFVNNVKLLNHDGSPVKYKVQHSGQKNDVGGARTPFFGPP